MGADREGRMLSLGGTHFLLVLGRSRSRSLPHRSPHGAGTALPTPEEKLSEQSPHTHSQNRYQSVRCVHGPLQRSPATICAQSRLLHDQLGNS